MLNNFKILTITHRHAKLGELGHYIIQNAEGAALKQELIDLKTAFNIDELMYVSTCNRVLYFFYTKQNVDRTFKKSFFHYINPKLNLDRVDSKVKVYQGGDALQHLYEVAASTDSMVVGEREILRQLREGYDFSAKAGLTGDNLRIAFQEAVLVAKDVYANTKIGEKPISVVSLAIQQLLKVDLPKDARIIMVGAGQTNTLVAKFLKKHHYSNVKVFNRTVDKAQKLANILGQEATAAPLQQLKEYRDGFDCLIVCTGATKAIIDQSLYSQLLNGDFSRKLVIDLSIPYNVAPKVIEKFAVNYVEIEGLEALAAQNMAFRKKEVLAAKEVVKKRTTDFQHIYQRRQITRALKTVPAEIKAVKEKALNEVFRKDLEHLDEETQQLLEKMMTYMEKKCIGIPMKAAQEVIL